MKLFGVDKDGKLTPYNEYDFKIRNREEMLESLLENNPKYIFGDETVLIIGRQVRTNLGSLIDLLGVDREGDLVVIELKRDRTPRDTIAQILEYASFVEDLSYEQLEGIFREYTGEENIVLTEYHRNYFELREDEAIAFNKNQKLIIIAQEITPEIKQTSTFLLKKGIDVFCLEFKYFENKAGEQIISSDFVVGKDSYTVKKVGSGTLPRLNKESFLNSVDQYGKEFFSRLLDFAEKNNLPIHWGAKGFSLNVDLNGNHINIAYCYASHSVYKQSFYAAIPEILRKVRDGEIVVEFFKKELNKLGGFKPAGNRLKCLVTKYFTKDKQDKLFEILIKVIDMIKQNGLNEENEI